jgi:chromosomal replication initiator protein
VVEHLLKDILQEEARRAVTIDQIQRRVAEHFDVRLADMTSKRRPANIAFLPARSRCIWRVNLRKLP